MKIGRYNYTGIGYSRRTPIPEKKPAPAAQAQEYVPKRKALLIGITYAGAGPEAGAGPAPGYAELKGPHADVADMRRLLVERYEYKESDIVVLLDSGTGVQPTRANILRAIDDLVRGARKGDRFFFHYCGHTTQIENRSNSEEDGMDECLVPLDGESNKILDNELRRHLVAALPVGSTLVAVFDSCHSASLLDLAHFRCNRVYVPWVSKGRRKSDERWNAVVRRHALPMLPLSKAKNQTPVHSPARSRANTHILSPALSRSNTLNTRAPAPTPASVASPLQPLPEAPPTVPRKMSASTSEKLLRKPSATATDKPPRKTPARTVTRRATREMRELMQLLESAPPPVPLGTQVPIPVERDEDEGELEPTRPNTPLLPSPTTYMTHAHIAPLVTTRRIYEAKRTSPRRVRAWRTEVDALEVDGEFDVGVVVRDGDEDEQMVGVTRAGTENDVRVRGGRGKRAKGAKDRDASVEPAPRKRASLPLMPIRLASLRAGKRVEQPQQEEAVADAKAKAKGKGKQRRTTVTHAHPVSVAVREGAGSGGGVGQGVGKENVAGAKPTLRVAVPRAPQAQDPEPQTQEQERASARPVGWLEDADRACESPAPVWPCTGWACRDPAHQHEEEDKAEVISLASCKDYQLSWEDANGGSMTRELVRILERDPHPTLRSLVTSVSHALHRMSVHRHLETLQYKRDMKKYAAFLERQRLNDALLGPGTPRGVDTETTADSISVSGASTLAPATPGATAPVSRSSSRVAAPGEEDNTAMGVPMQRPRAPMAKPKARSEGFVDAPVYDMDNFQDPQVASHRPLNMEQPWTI